MSTNVMSGKNIQRDRVVIDAKGQILGRLATKVAALLMGKTKASFVPYLDNGDYVVVTNASQIKVTGKKAEQKTYFRHSGFPGGDTVETFSRLIDRRPEEIIRHAVWGMLPKTKLGHAMVKKLTVYSGEAPVSAVRPAKLEKEEGVVANG